SFTITGGMCPRCEGLGKVTDFDRTALYDDSKSLNDGALIIPGYSMDGWYGRIYRGSGFFDPDKPIRDYNKRELHDLLYKEPTKSGVAGVHITIDGLTPQIHNPPLRTDGEAVQPAIPKPAARAATSPPCPARARTPPASAAP